MKIVLIGYMGSGKTTIGSSLADAIGYRFLDLDDEIEKQEAKSISEIFSSKGEVYFRKIENELLKNILASDEKIVLATGGGTPCYGDSVKFLNDQKNTLSIYLKISLENISDRLFDIKEHRPLISHLESIEDLRDFVRKHLFERSHYYNQAQLVLDINGLTATETVEKIVLELF